jgi:hypothetical protein
MRLPARSRKTANFHHILLLWRESSFPSSFGAAAGAKGREDFLQRAIRISLSEVL